MAIVPTPRQSWKKLKRKWNRDGEGRYSITGDRFNLAAWAESNDRFRWAVYDTMAPAPELAREEGAALSMDGAKLAAERTQRRLGNE